MMKIEPQYGNDRALKKCEEKWCNDLEKLLNKMPKTLEMCIDTDGNIYIRIKGTIDKYLKDTGHTDDIPSLKEILTENYGSFSGLESNY